MAKDDYVKDKITITISRKFLKKIDKIKKFPKWKNKRSPVFEAALEKYFDDIT